MLVALITVLGLLQVQKPPSMLAFEEARKAVVSGEIEFSMLRSSQPDSLFSYRARYARNGDRILEELGNQEGWTRFAYDPNTKQYTPESKIPTYYMQDKSGYWSRQHTTSSAYLWKEADRRTSRWHENAVDVRYLGMYVNGAELSCGPEAALRPVPEGSRVARWSEREVDGKYVVCGWTDEGMRIEWTIDPRRGWNAERIAGFHAVDGEEVLLTNCVIQLAQQDGIWFPSSVAYAINGQTHLSVFVHRCSLNKKTDPSAFSGTDFGLESGFTIAPQDFRAKSRRGLRWSDEGLVEATVWDKLERGGAKPGPTVMRERSGELTPLLTEQQLTATLAARRQRERDVTLAQHDTLWLAYVRWFIDRYALNDEQRQKAMNILENCQAEARKYLDTKRTEIEELFGDGRPVPTSGPIAEKRAALLLPLDRIFETRLKPRLATIPTRSQKEKVQRADETRKEAGK